MMSIRENKRDRFGKIGMLGARFSLPIYPYPNSNEIWQIYRYLNIEIKGLAHLFIHSLPYQYQAQPPAKQTGPK